jgi:hypothetical protein
VSQPSLGRLLTRAVRRPVCRPRGGMEFVRRVAHSVHCHGMRMRPIAASNRERERALASTYLITFVCYGARLPGTVGAVDRLYNVPGSRRPAPDADREARARGRMRQAPYVLDAVRREAILTAFSEVCWHRTCEQIMCTSWWKLAKPPSA